MAIKSDRWIREMSEKHGMIEPYAENQVRFDENGEKLISYGVSSYGYDVRCAREFKVFTNVHSAIVDPKHFDEKSFIDIESDVCIIPPNSFALARTVEYFRIVIGGIGFGITADIGFISQINIKTRSGFPRIIQILDSLQYHFIDTTVRSIG